MQQNWTYEVVDLALIMTKLCDTLFASTISVSRGSRVVFLIGIPLFSMGIPWKFPAVPVASVGKNWPFLLSDTPRLEKCNPWVVPIARMSKIKMDFMFLERLFYFKWPEIDLCAGDSNRHFLRVTIIIKRENPEYTVRGKYFRQNFTS